MSEEDIKKAAKHYAFGSDVAAFDYENGVKYAKAHYEQLLSSKEHECDQFKSQIEALHVENKDSEKELVSVIESLRAELQKNAADHKVLYESFQKAIKEIAELNKMVECAKNIALEHGEAATKIDEENARLRADNQRLDKIILEEPFQTIEKLRKQLDYKTEENKQNIITINDLRKRCEDLEAGIKKVLAMLNDKGIHGSTSCNYAIEDLTELLSQ